MAPRAQWKGFLTFGEVVCPVALFTAASTSDRIAFHTVNRDTGNRVRREFVDGVTGAPVGRDDQVKGYEVGKDDYIVLDWLKWDGGLLRLTPTGENVHRQVLELAAI